MARSVRTRGVRFTRVRSAVGVLVLLALAVSVLGTGPAASAGSPKFSTNIEHDFPVSIAGQNVVIDPRIAGAPEGGCELPADGDAVTPLDKDSGVGNLQIADDIFGGVWQCPEGAQQGTAFVAGLDAATAVSPPSGRVLDINAFIDAGVPEIEQRQVRVVKGVSQTVFIYGVTTEAGKFKLATAEPRKHVLVTALTPKGRSRVGRGDTRRSCSLPVIEPSRAVEQGSALQLRHGRCRFSCDNSPVCFLAPVWHRVA